MAVAPLNRTKIIHKITSKPIRFQSDRFKKLRGVSFLLLLTCGCILQKGWRKPRGIDCPTRRRFRGTVTMPNVGMRNNKLTRHLLPNGFKKFLVTCESDLDVLLMNNRTYCAEISQRVSAKKR